jgi:hypothetical protein
MDALAAANTNKLSGRTPLRISMVRPVPITKDRTNIDIAGYFFTKVDMLCSPVI